MIEFLIGYTTGVTFLDRLADFGAVFVLGLVTHLVSWHLWDRVRFTHKDSLDLRRIMGAYTGDTSIEPATHAAPVPRRRSPFALPRTKK